MSRARTPAHRTRTIVTTPSLIHFDRLILYSSIKNQVSELSTRLDNMESSIKSDVRTILDILHQQQQQYMQQKHLHVPLSDTQNVMTASYQPSGSDISIEHFGPDKRPRTSSSTIVQRSASQPECAAKEKSLLR